MSIYLGNTEIGQIFLGGTEIAEAYLGSTKVYESGGSPTPPTPQPPYDAEVEYLQSSGTQYIDTGVVGNLDTEIEVKFEVTTLSVFAAGVRPSNNNGITLYVANNGTQRFGNKSTTYTCAVNTLYVASINKTSFTINGTTRSLGATDSFTTNGNIYLMWANYQAGANAHAQGKFYYAKILDNGVLVRDFIPVRVGQVGYMYDKVSGSLFGNAGTGDFILGNDKN